MKLKNYEIKPLGDFLSSEGLSGKKSRMRTRFVKILNKHLTEVIEAERMQLIYDYADKDEQNSLLFTDEGKQNPVFTNENLEKFHREYSALLNEDFYIEENEANREVLTAVAHILLNSEAVLSGEDALIYDNWCEIFEQFLKGQESS